MVCFGRGWEPTNEAVGRTILVKLRFIVGGLGQVTLVGGQDNWEGLAVGEGDFGVNFTLPVGHRCERGGVGQVVHEDGPKGVPVVHPVDVSKAILPRQVPQLQRDSLALVLDAFEVEIYSQCGLVKFCEVSADSSGGGAAR